MEAVLLNDAPGSRLTQGHVYLAGCGVTSDHWQNNVIKNPAQRRLVAAAIKGDAMAQVSFDQVLEREVSLTNLYCEIAEQPFPGDGMIEKALRMTEVKRGISVNDRFVLGGLGLPELFDFFYRFNARMKEERRLTMKLYHQPRQEWWRTDKGVQHLPTKPGIFSWDFRNTMRVTDLAGRPFMLIAEAQDMWAMECGGSGRSSVEQITYLFQRHLLERGLPMWGGGSIRGKNAYRSDISLSAFFNAAHGFGASNRDHSEQDWSLGAIPEVFLELAP